MFYAVCSMDHSVRRAVHSGYVVSLRAQPESEHCGIAVAHNHISEQQYFAGTKQLILDAWGGRIEIDQVNIFSPGGQSAVEALARKHSLDLSDALQLETIMKGTYSFLCSGFVVGVDYRRP